jgi:3-oxoacyl-[acyl-carrier protein] reductase
MGKFSGKVAVVTGGNRGIGRAIVERLVQDGATVVFSYNSNPKDANDVVAAVEKAGGKAVAVQANVAKLAEVKKLFEAADKFGRLDMLVNNAGVPSGGMLESITEEEFDRVVNVNVKGVLFCTQEAVKRLKSGGRIINITSSSANFPTAGVSLYTMSKLAPKAFTMCWAKELGPRGITVNGVSPGATVPGMFENAPPAVKEMAEKGSPFGRLGRADEMGSVVSFLCSEDASWISGEHILVNGAGIA